MENLNFLAYGFIHFDNEKEMEGFYKNKDFVLNDQKKSRNPQ